MAKMQKMQRTFWFQNGDVYELVWKSTSPFPGDGYHETKLTLLCREEEKAELRFFLTKPAVDTVEERWSHLVRTWEGAIRLYLSLLLEPELLRKSRGDAGSDGFVWHSVTQETFHLLCKARKPELSELALSRALLGHFHARDRGTGVSFHTQEHSHYAPAWVDMERIATTLSLLEARGFLSYPKEKESGSLAHINATNASRLMEVLELVDDGTQELQLTWEVGEFRFSTTPFSWKHLELRDIGLFQNFEISFSPKDKAQQGQWALFLGENGVGKTTLLRAFALLTCQEHVSHALLGSERVRLVRWEPQARDSSFETQRCRSKLPYFGRRFPDSLL